MAAYELTSIQTKLFNIAYAVGDIKYGKYSSLSELLSAAQNQVLYPALRLNHSTTPFSKDQVRTLETLAEAQKLCGDLNTLGSINDVAFTRLGRERVHDMLVQVIERLPELLSDIARHNCINAAECEMLERAARHLNVLNPDKAKN